MLEDDVEEKYFLNDDMLARFCERSLEIEENDDIDNDDEFDFNLQEDAECLRGGGVVCTINTRYDEAATSDYVSLKHYPKSCVIEVYERDERSEDNDTTSN